MKAQDWEKIKNVFAEVLEQPLSFRAEYLRQSCGADARLFTEVKSLLAAHDETENLIEKNAFDVAANITANGGNYKGKQFGNYRIVREIGRGGMGAVFLAERTDGEFEQQVALKIVRQTFADEELKKRFRRERQILASLNHPNIARLLDGGISESGEPFLAMEYVEGEPLLEFAEKRNLEIEERLKLFLEVCSAVAYAHRNLIVHRDIKPSNILVTEAGTPKLLDFGLAKILVENFLDMSQTETAFRAFTPAYASPEQMRGGNITTASDVYSLGVIFYELLSGERPFRFENKSYEEILRSIDTLEPPRPSSVVSSKFKVQGSKSDSETSPNKPQRTTNDEQTTNPKSKIRNPKSLEGDLDNIALMALRKEPERRYESVEAFAADIERYLTGLPVAARRATFQYRASKFAGRNKIGVSAAALILLSLFVGLGTALWQAGVAREKARIAEENQIRAEENIAKAELAAEKQKKITRFMEKVLSYASPAWYAEGNRFKEPARVIDVLNDLSGKIETEFPDDVDIQAELHHKCAEIFLANGIIDRAKMHALRALELRRQVFGERHPEVAKDLYYLGEVLGLYGNHIERQKLLDEAAAIFREVALDNANLPYLLENLGGDEAKLFGNFDEAEKLFAESLELFRRRDGEIHYNTARLYLDLSLNAARKGDMTRAEELFREGETRMAQLPNGEQRLRTLLVRGELESAKGNSAAAEATFKQLIDEIRKIKGANSRFEQDVRYDLLNVYEREKDWANVARLQRARVEETRKTLPETSVRFGRELAWLSVLLLRDGRTAEARPVFEKAYRIFRNNDGDEEKTWLDLKTNIGECLLLLNRRAEALPLLEENYEFYKANYPPNFRDRIRAAKLLEQTR